MSKNKLLVCYIPFIICILSFFFCGSTKSTKADSNSYEETRKDYTFIAPTFISKKENTIPTFSVEDIEEPTPTIMPTPEPTPEPLYNFTDEEIDLLARLIDAEAGVESYKCKVAVGSVVLNRLESEDFPDTLEEVIYQRKPCVQFSVILRDNSGDAPIDDSPSKDSIKAARYLILNGSTLPEDVLVFYADYVDEGWVTHQEKYGKIDHTVFAYVRGK
jgi:spore germination cell wall hydrolase CwlJ-like protein